MLNSIKGVVKKDIRTKNLCKRLVSGNIALLAHENIDAVAAQELIEKKVKAVINAWDSINGDYPIYGAQILLENNIPLLDKFGMELFNSIREGDSIEIIGSKIFQRSILIGRGRVVTLQLIKEMMSKAEQCLKDHLDLFVQNTLEYARKEKDVLLGPVSFPKLKTKLTGKHVLVVIRGKNYKQDLRAVLSYIREIRPVLIGVDGGADALCELKLTPDLVIGDMDSICDRTLKKAGEIIVHSYMDGTSPGLARIEALGLKAHKVSLPGTSEDLALLLAYEHKALLIVAVGAHSHMTDFLEKGRKGMSSTLLIRLKVGERLVDARGLAHLYRSSGIRLKYYSALLAAVLFPFLVLSAVSPLARHFFYLLFWKISLF